MVQLLQYSFKLQYMTGAGTGTGAAIMDNSGTGAGVRICRKKFWLRNTVLMDPEPDFPEQRSGFFAGPGSKTLNFGPLQYVL